MLVIPRMIRWVNRGPDIKVYNPRTSEFLYLDELHQDVWMTVAAGLHPFDVANRLAIKYRWDEAVVVQRLQEIMDELLVEGLLEQRGAARG